MAVIDKNKYLRQIAELVGKGAVCFDLGDRPALEMGGHTVFVRSVSFDTERGEFTYAVSNVNGEILPSAHGVRPLSGLDIGTLNGIADVVRRIRGRRLQVSVDRRLESPRKGPSM